MGTTGEASLVAVVPSDPSSSGNVLGVGLWQLEQSWHTVSYSPGYPHKEVGSFPGVNQTGSYQTHVVLPSVRSVSWHVAQSDGRLHNLASSCWSSFRNG